MEGKCENCIYDIRNGGDECMCTRCFACDNFNKFEPIKKEIKPMEKKYKIRKYFPFNGINLKLGTIFKESEFKMFDIGYLIGHYYIEEVEEDTLDSIILKWLPPVNEEDTQLLLVQAKSEINNIIIEQKIELLEEVRELFLSYVHTNTTEHNIFINTILSKISKLEKEEYK